MVLSKFDKLYDTLYMQCTEDLVNLSCCDFVVEVHAGCGSCLTYTADLGMCGLCGRTGAPTKRGPPHEDKHNFFIAANLLQHANMPKNH